MSENKSYRIRTKVGEEPGVINVHLDQSYDLFEILSLKLTQEDAYKLYTSSYGVIVGRIIANGGFGIPNAKVSVFVEVSDEDYLNNEKNYLYPYFSTSSVNNEGIRYNLLPDEPINDCYQNVGTFPNKRLVLDNDTVLEIYDKYWKYTSVTNEAGDYMIFGVPTGQQQIHVDIDLSDIGALSQRPRDMIYKGYNINQFESPNKFKQSTNLDSLSQIYTQNTGVNVYPFWGDSEESDGNIAITRADVQIEYLFEPTCVFIGSIVTDTGTNAIGKNCTPMTNAGKMDQLTTGEGSIEMIRKTLNGAVEEYQIKGNRVIDGDGVWCYQIPMNLDYVATDEYGNIVPTDDPTKGIPTRARVRFRVSIDDSPNDATARKRCKVLVPNNPKIDNANPIYSKTKQVDYEFGTSTREESYRDLFWNKVYTVKSYIPRLQNNTSYKNRKHSGIKMVNHFGSNNPMPYNSVSLKLGFMFRMICVIAKVIIDLIAILNNIIALLGWLPCWLGNLCLKIWKFKICPFKFILKMVPTCVRLTSDFCDDDINKKTYYPGCFGCVWDETKKKHEEENKSLINSGRADEATIPDASRKGLFTCVENELAQDNDVTSFNFANDWLNGVIYAPLWFRKITPKKRFLFGLIKIKAKDQWCSATQQFGSQKLYQPCSLWMNSSTSDSYKNNEGKTIIPYRNIGNNSTCDKNECHRQISTLDSFDGIIVNNTTMLKQTVYYYTPVYFNSTTNTLQTLYATDIVLLGSLNDCDLDGIPQFFKYLESTTYNMPSDILFTDTEVSITVDNKVTFTTDTEMTGADWGNYNPKDQCNKSDGGLFYGVGCSTIEVHTKSCANLQRICELGVSLDETISIRDLNNQTSDINKAYSLLVADGYVSKDELQENDARSMFATLNGNNLKTVLDNSNGLLKYDFNYLYPNNFDGSLHDLMENAQKGCGGNISYKFNYNIEQFSRDYYKFRMGDNPLFYKSDNGSVAFPRYENSFYFYFGLVAGKTAIEKFNSQFFSTCTNSQNEPFNVGIITISSSWCGDNNGTILLNLTDISTPYEIIINGISDGIFSRVYKDITDTKIYLGTKPSDYADYHNVPDEDGRNDGLPNGDYEVTITDSDGSIVQKEISLTPLYLSYMMNSIDFKIPNNILKQTYGTYNNVRIAKLDGWQGDGKGWRNGQPGENSDNIGGRIIIENVSSGDDTFSPVKNDGTLKDTLLTRGYTIRLTKLVEETTIEYTTDENGNIQTVTKVTTKSVPIQLTEQEILSGILECDEGGQAYQVDVIELCQSNGKYVLETNNIVTKVINITEPLPVKMFINDIDYELIQNFKCGWKKSGTNWVQDPSNFVGWDKIGDIDNPAYNWSDEILKLPDELQIEAKQEIISQMKDAFWITCSGASKTVGVVGQSNNFPITYGIQYQNETNSDNDTIIIDSAYTITNDSSISGIAIPTLLSKDSNTNGSVVANYGKLNIEKIPYFFAMKDNINNVLPINANINSGSVGSSNTSEWFGIHLIDKILKVDMVVWSGIRNPQYFQELPYNGGKEWDDIVKDGYYNGMLRGIINNGIVNNSEIKTADFCRKWYQAIFDTITIGTIVPLVETVTFKNNGEPDENALPTKRRFVGNKNDKSLLGFPCNIPGDYDLTAIRIPLIDTTLEIDDGSSGCNLSEEIYGAMEVVLGDNLNDCTKDDAISHLSVNISNGDTSNAMTYVLIKTYNQVYPYPNHEFTSITGKSAIYGSGVTQTDIIEQGKIDAVGESNTSEINEEGDTINIPTTGYGTTGIFQNITGTPTVYIVGMTQNNCRVISPVYDFRKVSASITLEMVEEVINVETSGSTTGDTSGSTTGSTTGGTEGIDEGDEPTPTPDPEPSDPGSVKVRKYKFIVTIDACDQWYIANFDSIVSITCNAVKNQPFGMTMTYNEGNIIQSSFVIEITKEVFDAIMQENPNIFEKPTIPYTPIPPVENLLNATTVDITDKLGMVTRCKLSYKNPKPIIQ